MTMCTTFQAEARTAERTNPAWFQRFEDLEALHLNAAELDTLAATSPSPVLAGYLHALASLKQQGLGH